MDYFGLLALPSYHSIDVETIAQIGDGPRLSRPIASLASVVKASSSRATDLGLILAYGVDLFFLGRVESYQ